MYNELIFDYKTYYLNDDNEWVYIRNVLAGVPDKRTLDETLNESGIQINAVELDKPFEPFTKIKRETIDHKTHEVLGTIYSYVASDVVTLMSFVKPLYQHNIVLIEPIKKLERYVCDNLTFRNPLLLNNLNPIEANGEFEKDPNWVKSPTSSLTWKYRNDDRYLTPKSNIQKIKILPMQAVFRSVRHNVDVIISENSIPNGCKLTIQQNYNIPIDVNVNDEISLIANSTYKIQYYFYYKWVDGHSAYAILTFTIYTYTSNLNPNYSITSVCNRIFSLTPTRLASESPLFKLDNTFADNYANIEAPEFTFTQKTLFDSLIEIGKSIQSIPYIKIDPNNDKAWNTIDFEFIGGNRKFKLENEKLSAYNNNWSCEQYCDCIDSTVNNIMPSKINKQGTVYEPYINGFLAARCETGILDESTVELITSRQLSKNDKVIISGKTIGTNIDYDITSFIYEKTNYDALSNYSGGIYSKAYALYYEYGQKNIKGLFYKVEDSVSPALSKPAIQNILEYLTGNNITLDYKNIFYRIEYTPFINARLKQYKTHSLSTKHNSTLIYNQQTNITDSRAYGNNMYGTVSRLGNQNPILTYCLTDYSLIPCVGELTSNGYYVSIVELEYWQQFIKCTVTLSKDFNRLSEYVGIKSYERFYEVDPTMALERYVNIDDFAIISTKKHDNNNSFITEFGILSFGSIFVNDEKLPVQLKYPINFAKSINKTVDNSQISNVALTVSSLAFGNSIALITTYQDNYAATSQIVSEKIASSSDRLFSKPYQYTDIFGKITNLDIEFSKYVENQEDSTYSYPNATYLNSVIPCVNINNLQVEKDSGEVLSITYQMHFIADENNIVIGNRLAENNSLIGMSNKVPAKLAFFTDKIGSFVNQLIPKITLEIDWTTFINGYYDGKYIEFGTIAAPIDCESWAIVDSENNLLFGMNEILEKGEKISQLFINFTRNY